MSGRLRSAALYQADRRKRSQKIGVPLVAAHPIAATHVRAEPRDKAPVTCVLSGAWGWGGGWPGSPARAISSSAVGLAQSAGVMGDAVSF